MYYSKKKKKSLKTLHSKSVIKIWRFCWSAGVSLNRLGPRQRGLKSKARRETRSDDVVQGWGDVSSVQLASLPQGGPDRGVLLQAVGRVLHDLSLLWDPSAGNLLLMWELDSWHKCKEDQGHGKAMLGKFVKQIFQRPQDRLFAFHGNSIII